MTRGAPRKIALEHRLTALRGIRSSASSGAFECHATTQRRKRRMPRTGTDKRHPCDPGNPGNPWSKTSTPSTGDRRKNRGTTPSLLSPLVIWSGGVSNPNPENLRRPAPCVFHSRTPADNEPVPVPGTRPTRASVSVPILKQRVSADAATEPRDQRPPAGLACSSR